jgi:heme oxygenase
LIERIIVAVMTKLVSWLLSKGLEKLHGVNGSLETKRDIDARLKSFKDAYKEAFDGTEITPEQRAKLRQSIADFIRGTGNGGL